MFTPWGTEAALEMARVSSACSEASLYPHHAYTRKQGVGTTTLRTVQRGMPGGGGEIKLETLDGSFISQCSKHNGT